MSSVLVAWWVLVDFRARASFADLDSKRFPYYFTFKTIFILYLILPSTRGAHVIYTKAFRPLMSSSKTSSTPVAAPQ